MLLLSLLQLSLPLHPQWNRLQPIHVISHDQIDRTCLTFFAGARLDAVVVFFTGPALALPASVFFGGAGFLAVGTFAAAGFFLVGPVTVFVASLALVFEAGLEF